MVDVECAMAGIKNFHIFDKGEGVLLTDISGSVFSFAVHRVNFNNFT